MYQILELTGNAHHGSITALSPPDAHVCCRRGSNHHTEHRGQCAVCKAKAEQQRAQQSDSKIVRCDVRAEPEKDHLDVAEDRRRMSLVGHHARDAALLEEGRFLDPGVP